MDNIELDKRLAFIADLDLPAADGCLREPLPGGHGGIRASAGQPSAYIDAGSLLSFGADVDDVHLSDVLDSTLYAQLVTNHKVNREDQPLEWYTTYHQILSMLGWTQPVGQFSRYNASSSHIFLNRVVLELLPSVTPADALPSVDASMRALMAIWDGDRRVRLWDSSTHDATRGNFQVGSVSVSGNNAVLRQGEFFFSTTQSTARFLWVDYPTGTMELDSRMESMTLDGSFYGNYRNVIKGKLGDHVKDYVISLDV